MTGRLTTERTLWALLFFVLFMNVMTWFYARHMRVQWLNVPPAPSVLGASSFTLGDQQFAYRVFGLMLQNMGDSGGRVVPLKDYDFDNLSGWFYLEDRLDPHSDYIPFLAAYYYGSVQDPAKLASLVEYLRHVGRRTEGEKWRWLAHAVYLARFKMENLDYAYEMALELAALDNPDMPTWTRQMPAFIMNAKGDKETAYAIMLEILGSRGENLDPAEVYFTRDYICTRILDAAEAKDDPLCQNIP